MAGLSLSDVIVDEYKPCITLRTLIVVPNRV